MTSNQISFILYKQCYLQQQKLFNFSFFPLTTRYVTSCEVNLSSNWRTDELNWSELSVGKTFAAGRPVSGSDVGGAWSAGGPSRLPVSTTAGQKSFASSKKRVGTMSCSMTVCWWRRKIRGERGTFLPHWNVVWMDSSNLENVKSVWHRLKVYAWRVIDKKVRFNSPFICHLLKVDFYACSYCRSPLQNVIEMQDTPSNRTPRLFPHYFCNPFSSAHIVPLDFYPPFSPHTFW